MNGLQVQRKGRGGALTRHDYKINGRRSPDRVEDAVAHLDNFFGQRRALDITSDQISAYVAMRKEEGASNATINREQAALKRMFRLGERAGKVAQRPHIAMLEEDNVRQGFFEESEFRAVLAQLADDLQPVFETVFVTGWRIRSELLTRQRRHVDLQAGWLRLEPGETKNRKGRMFPLMPTLRVAIERQIARTEEVERTTGQIIPWLFHRAGKPIKSFRRAWLTACKKAGILRVPHDFRRTAVRNLERAGVPRATAMAMVGHKTESIYGRYAIVDETMLNEGAEKLERFYASSPRAPHNVVDMDEARVRKS
jgi:integrase